jgi:hypothetical protein
MTFNLNPQKNQRHETALRSQLAMLRSRYDSGAVPPPVYAIIYAIETEIAWLEHQREQCEGAAR